MSAMIALLRGVNVGGAGKVAMGDLKAMLIDLGFSEPKSLLNSGNLVFHAKNATPAELEALLERETESRLGLRTRYMVRTASEWSAIVRANPFPDEARGDPGHLLMMALKDTVAAEAVKALQAKVVGREVIGGHGRQIYVVYPDGVGTSKLTGQVIERTLQTSATGRNWNTVLKLAALAGD